jgi:hypothetical protein
MKKNVILILLLFTLSCEKDNLKSINDLEVHIDLLNENHNSTRVFNYGEDLIFEYIENNNTSDTIFYYGSHCPTFLFKVYDKNDNLIGDAIPNHWGCTAILRLLNIAPKETIVSEINWFNDTTNAPLPIGRYKLKFENTIDIPEINESKKYDLMIEFKVK